MPLYMDIHVMDSVPITEEDAYKAHLKDVAVQDKYGVVYKKYYINFQHNTIFCLMDSPNKDVCHKSHNEAHGIGPCNIVEVSPEYEFHPYLGEGSKNDKDLALTLSGEIDTGYRTLMMICLSDFSGKCGKYIDQIYRLLEKHKGSKIMQPDDKIMASFIDASDAISCCMAASELLKGVPENIDYTAALVTGKPVDEVGSDFFGETKKRLQILCRMGRSKVLHIDMGTKAITRKNIEMPLEEKITFKNVSVSDIAFYEVLWTILDTQITDPDFKSEHLCKKLGLSKAQTYRNIKALTGMSPNTLIREMRLRRSLEALKQNSKTVSEIAYELGFNSPTYFTRVFRKRYTLLPTQFAKLSNSHSI